MGLPTVTLPETSWHISLEVSYGEEGYEYFIHKVLDVNRNELMHWTKNNEGQIESITFTSDQFALPNGIGISDLIAEIPDGEITNLGYSYISGGLSFYCPGHNAEFFISTTNALTKDQLHSLGGSDFNQLSKNDLRPDAKIENIRIWNRGN